MECNGPRCWRRDVGLRLTGVASERVPLRPVALNTLQACVRGAIFIFRHARDQVLVEGLDDRARAPKAQVGGLVFLLGVDARLPNRDTTLVLGEDRPVLAVEEDQHPRSNLRTAWTCGNRLAVDAGALPNHFRSAL